MKFPAIAQHQMFFMCRQARFTQAQGSVLEMLTSCEYDRLNGLNPCLVCCFASMLLLVQTTEFTPKQAFGMVMMMTMLELVLSWQLVGLMKLATQLMETDDNEWLRRWRRFDVGLDGNEWRWWWWSEKAGRRWWGWWSEVGSLKAFLSFLLAPPFFHLLMKHI